MDFAIDSENSKAPHKLFESHKPTALILLFLQNLAKSDVLNAPSQIEYCVCIFRCVKSFFITGATGFVGQRLVKALDGEIRVLSRTRQSNYETVICDLQSDAIPNDALNEVDTVFHLAGIAHDIRDESKIKELYQKVNIDATIQLAELAIKSGVKNFLFVSSVKAGGLPLFGQCLSEENQGEPDSIYGQTKREAEIKLLEIGRNSNMHISIIRPS